MGKGEENYSTLEVDVEEQKRGKGHMDRRDGGRRREDRWMREREREKERERERGTCLPTS